MDNEYLALLKEFYSSIEYIRQLLEEGTAYENLMAELENTETILQEQIEVYGEIESSERPSDSLDVDSAVPLWVRLKTFFTG